MPGTDNKARDLAERLWETLRGGFGGRPMPRICGDIPMRIDRDGTWFYQGGPIGRPEMVRLFSGMVHRDAEGGYWLAHPGEMARIRVEDVPFIGVALYREGCGADRILSVRTNVGDRIAIDADHPLRMGAVPGDGGAAPYLTVRAGLEARLTRSVYYELADLAEPMELNGATWLGVWSGGDFFPIGKTETDD